MQEDETYSHPLLQVILRIKNSPPPKNLANLISHRIIAATTLQIGDHVLKEKTTLILQRGTMSSPDLPSKKFQPHLEKQICLKPPPQKISKIILVPSPRTQIWSEVKKKSIDVKTSNIPSFVQEIRVKTRIERDIKGDNILEDVLGPVDWDVGSRLRRVNMKLNSVLTSFIWTTWA
ncbi:hypothetical protein Leryth_025920 [Lithospermum erythrorhizon]|nr:hypothetical protein Leryth_025920 [Lithospermum erythrorhizon]